MSEPTFPGGRLVDLAGIAVYLNLPVRYIRRLHEENRIPVTQFTPGGRLFFDLIEIDRWVARNTVKARVLA